MAVTPIVGTAEALIRGPVYQHAPATAMISGGHTNKVASANSRDRLVGIPENATAAIAFSARNNERGQTIKTTSTTSVNNQYIVHSAITML